MKGMGKMGRKKAMGPQLMKTTTGKGVMSSVGKLHKKSNAMQETSKITRA